MARAKQWSKERSPTLPSGIYFYKVSHSRLGETLMGPYTRRTLPDPSYTLLAVYEYTLNREGNYILKVL